MSPNKDVSAWSRRLEAGQSGDPDLDLVARLIASRPIAPAPAPDFVRGLQGRLAYQAAAATPARRLNLSWLGSAAGLVLLVLVIFSAMWLLPGSPLRNGLGLAGLPAAEPGPPRLVYPCGASTICAAGPDGSHAVTLLSIPDEHMLAPQSVSPDGRYLLVAGHPDIEHLPADFVPSGIPDVGRIGHLYSFDLATNTLVMLADRFAGTDLAIHTSAWLPDGSVVFIKEDEQRQTALYRIQPDGSGLTRLTSLRPTPTHWSLIPAPDTERVYWQAAEVEDQTVSSGAYWWSTTNGDQTQELAWLELEDNGLGEVRFSPAGGLMAYDERWDKASIFIANQDSSGPRQIWTQTGEQPAMGLSPRFYWAPDGQSLLFELSKVQSDPEQFAVTYALYDLQTGQFTDLPEVLTVLQDVAATQSWTIGLPPQWSPDGRTLLISHPDYPYPKLLDLETMTVTDALTNAVQPGELGWQTVLWVP